jgi:hypothetical protein
MIVAMLRLAIAATLLAVPAVASADPTMRFGLTFGVDRNMPEAKQYGPLLGVGLAHDRFSAEANYSYLSFMDPDTKIHRVGLNLRADLWRQYKMGICNNTPHGYGCLQSKAFFGGIGVARRFGHWRATDTAMNDTTSQREVSATLGYELGLPGSGAWDLGFRFAVARRDPELYNTCRSTTGVSCPQIGYDPPGAAVSAMLEWTWIYGR